MKRLLILYGLFQVVTWTEGLCPNSCSGHGICGENDHCICHSMFMGGDCSMRICSSHTAWAAGPQGDLNFDGDMYDGTQYSDDYEFTAGSNYLATDYARGGTWEWWPSFHSQTYDEGHFYMECANRGICDRDTGICNCFEGYEGEGCRRKSCPNRCSGHGRCLSINQLAADEGLYTYALWDGDMMYTCKCDPGFQGTDCSEKLCPKGDDPLTTGHSVNEIQWVDVQSAGTGAGDLGGSVTLKFTDSFGEVWETDPVNIQNYDASESADAMATAIEAALEAIPNDIIPSVSVTAGFCEKVLPGKFKDYDASAATESYNGGTNPSGFLRCPNNDIGGLDASFLLVDLSTGFVAVNGLTGDLSGTYDLTAVGVAPSTSTADVTCNLVTYPQCVRFKIEFSSNPGDLADLSVNVDATTRNSLTNDQDATALISAVVTDELTLVDDATATFGYTLTSGEVVTAGDVTGTITVGTKTINFGGAPDTVLVTFPVNSKIRLKCTEGGTEYNLGVYTVSATSTAAAAIVTVEAIINDNGYCSTNLAGIVSVEKVTHYIDTNVDLTNENLVGMVPYVSTFSVASQEAKTVIDALQYPAAGVGHIFLSGTSELTATVASGAGNLVLKGTGTKENAECGDRGLCDRETGVCKCFKGYSGSACGTQNALVA